MVEGSLSNVPLADVIQIVTTGHKSGLLSLERNEARAKVYVEQGKIQVAHMTPGTHLGEILVRMDLLTTREVQEILDRQSREHAGIPLGMMAVQAALIKEADLQRALRRQAVEVLAELLTWRDGTFEFAERPVGASQAPTEGGHDAMQLLMDADELRRDIDGGTADPNTVFRRAGDPTLHDLPPGAWELLGAIDGRRPARAVVADADFTETDGLSILKAMAELGVISEVEEQGRETTTTVLVVCASPAVQRLLRLALQRVGMRVELIETPAAALAALYSVRPNVLLVDDRGGDGWALVREVRGAPGIAHLPALVLTDPRESTGPLARWRRPKADVLPRPFDELELQQRVAKLAGRKLV